MRITYIYIKERERDMEMSYEKGMQRETKKNIYIHLIYIYFDKIVKMNKRLKLNSILNK